MRILTFGLLLFPVLALAAPVPGAKTPANVKPATDKTQDSKEAPEEDPWVAGPKKIDLGHDLTLDMPDGFVFLDKANSAKILEKNGQFHNDNLAGMVASADVNAPWIVIIRYDAEGLIKDDESVDAEELLEAMREGQAEANEERKAKGFDALTLTGWTEKPRYERSLHHFVWGLEVASSRGQSINYNTRILGRNGYVSLNLVDDPQNIEGSKPHVQKLLAATTFNAGARYEDFNASTDKVAEYGLAGLVLGGAGFGAAKLVKIGLLAKFSKVLLGLLIAGKKFIVLALLGVGAIAKKLFAGKNKPNEPTV